MVLAFGYAILNVVQYIISKETNVCEFTAVTLDCCNSCTVPGFTRLAHPAPRWSGDKDAFLKIRRSRFAPHQWQVSRVYSHLSKFNPIISPTVNVTFSEHFKKIIWLLLVSYYCRYQRWARASFSVSPYCYSGFSRRPFALPIFVLFYEKIKGSLAIALFSAFDHLTIVFPYSHSNY